MSDTILWCLVEGDASFFAIRTSPTIFISELRELIQKKTQTNIPAHRLNLWQVDVDLGGIRAAIRKGEYQFKPTHDQQPLWEERTISDTWPQQPPHGQLHVYITLPANMSNLTLAGPTATITPPAPQDDHPAKRQRLGNESVFSWLKEVRSKIWNEERLVPQLFRRVEVTLAHFTELQRRLNEQYSDRDSPEYDGRKHNVRDVKLALLRSIPPSSPQHPDNNEDQAGHGDGPKANYEDDLDIKSHFPFTFNFLDLSTLDLKEEVLDRLPLPLFLRQDYDDISALIEKEPQGRKGSVIVTGQPGTGKTAYLHLKVILFMIKGCPFLYQARNGTVFHVNEDGVQEIESWPSNTGIVAFVDGDKRHNSDYEPHDMLFKDRVQIIMASSPKGTMAQWIWQKQDGHITTIATNLWSASELFIAGIFLYPFDISVELLRESTSYFGYHPRLCFSSAHSVKVLDDVKVDVKRRIRSLDSKQSNIFQLVDSSWTGDNAVSHSIFEISPLDEFRRLGDCTFKTVSGWAFDRLMEVYDRQEAHAVAAFYHHISITPEAATLWGHVFESRVLNRIDAGGYDFPIRRLTLPEEETTWTCRKSPIPRSKFLQKNDFIEQLTKAFEENEPLHLVPAVPNFKAVDSILYIPNEVLTCIQATVSSKDHGIHVPGLRVIQSWLGVKRDPLAHLRPSKDRPWRFIFIVPPDKSSSFGFQRLEHDTDKGAWAEKIHQYVLGLNVLE